MPTSTKVKNLNINELTEAQYDAAVQGGVIGANELSVLTDVDYVEPSDLATVATTGDYSDLINRPTNLVSTNTAQTISGMKTFSGDITLSGTTSIKNNTGGTNYTMLYRDATTIHVGASTSVLKLEGSGTRPAYNSGSLALLSDITGGLPSQTGQSGKFLTTDGTDASWSDKPLVNRATGTNGIGIGGSSLVASGNNSIAVGPNPQATAPGAIAIGVDARATVADGIAIGDYARSTANKAYQIGGGTNGTANSFQVGSHQLLNLSDGTIPTARLTKVNTTVTLAAADWSSNTQTVSVTGMTATGVVMVSPDPTDTADYVSAGILCTAQAAGSLSFSCDTVPSADIDVNVVML